MNLSNKVAVVTGGASGIGAAMAAAFVREGARAVVIADVADGTAVAAGTGPQVSFRTCDVTSANDVSRLVEDVWAEVGPIDLLCANAGIATGLGVDANDDVWSRVWSVNVMGIVHSARAYLPKVVERGHGHLLVTASAAGLLTNLGDAPYTATKHAAVGLAEWLSITHGDDGLTVQCLCPQGVRTPMVTGGLDDGQLAAEVVAAQGLIEPEECAAAVVAGLATEDFLILPHPEVRDFMRRKVDDPGRWLGGMRKLRSRLSGGG
jgi:NAD(P)-dependent dehydrogenase (short-subunit alcohol dehydrogenase family)